MKKKGLQNHSLIDTIANDNRFQESFASKLFIEVLKKRVNKTQPFIVLFART